MIEAFLIVIACVLSYFVGTLKTKTDVKDEQADSVQRADKARYSVHNGDNDSISADVFNRDNGK